MTKAISETYSLFYLPKLGRFARFSAPSCAYIYYKSFRIDLLTGVREEVLIEQFLESMQEFKLENSYERPRVYHLFYELGYIIENSEELAKENIPLAIELEYEECSMEDIHGRTSNFEGLDILQYPSYKDYSQKFKQGRIKLINGECYQFNLTAPFYFKLKDSTTHDGFINKAWSEAGKASAFAHCTYVAELNKMFFSNSPECLFHYKPKPTPVICSMPIKGTVKVSKDEEREEAWEKLRSCSKNEAELFMITDLVRNDLTRIQLSPAKVKSKRLALNVPGIVHQFSIVEAQAHEGLDLYQVVKGLFPGGSVTGAPKKNVLKILRELEGYDRGFYCGSTIVLHNNLKAGSINIRSCEIDFASLELKYCSGGGITLNSSPESEFDEIYAKVESFLHLLKL